MDVTTRYTVSIDRLVVRIDWYVSPTQPEMIEVPQEILRSSRYHPDLRLLVVDHSSGTSLRDSQARETFQAAAPLLGKFKSYTLTSA